MKILVPVDASAAALAPILRLIQAGIQAEILALNVQPAFHRHISQFTSRASREQIRAERSAAAMAQAIELLASAGIPFRALSEVGRPAARIAAVAEREQVDEIMMGVGRHPAWLRWLNPSIAQGVMALTDIPVTVLARGQPTAFQRFAVPAGVAGIAALLLSAE
jgi:nucleotide-binding universal stress UspA family protein